MQNKNELEVIFDESYKNMIFLSHTLNEAIIMYKNNPTEEMKYLINKMSHNALSQIQVLLDMLPKVCKGEILNNYKFLLNDKFQDIWNIQKEIANILAK